MSHEILIDDLRRKGELKIKEIWETASKEIEALQETYQAELDSQIATLENRKKETFTKVPPSILFEVEVKINRIYSEAERQLANRCYTIAEESLSVHRDEGYGALFQQLVYELPKDDWQKVWVNVKDEGLAAIHFTNAKIIHDTGIVGGFRVSAADGGFQVSNTLEKRLEKAWPFLFPELLKDLKETLYAETSD